MIQCDKEKGRVKNSDMLTRSQFARAQSEHKMEESKKWTQEDMTDSYYESI